MKRWISFILVLCLLGLLPVGAFAKTPFYEDKKAIAHAAESVVMLTCYDNAGNVIATGSGFLALEDSVIITNHHVIEGAISAIKANTEDDMYFEVDEILCYDETSDIAILKTNAKTRLDLLRLASSSVLDKGSRVVAIGSPLGLRNTVSEGIYSGVIQDETEYILFTAAISSGSSGGALFNEYGEVIGVTAATYTEGQNLNLAVPIEKVVQLWNAYKSGNITSAHNKPSDDNYTLDELFQIAKEHLAQNKYEEAVDLFTKAAVKGHAGAQYELGCCYRGGYGVNENDTKAVEWFTKAAEQEYEDAQWALGRCYYNGEGVLKDYNKAKEWFVKAQINSNHNGSGLSFESFSTLLDIDSELYNALMNIN